MLSLTTNPLDIHVYARVFEDNKLSFHIHAVFFFTKRRRKKPTSRINDINDLIVFRSKKDMRVYCVCLCI